MGVDNANVARRYLNEIWGKGNLDVIDELVGADIVLRDPMTPDAARGIDQLRERVSGMNKIFSDASLTIHDIIVSGDRAAVRTTWRGKHTGEFFGIAGTKRTVTCESVELLRIEGGKVVENDSYFDAYTMFQQIGVLPPPDRLRESPQKVEDTRPGAQASTS